MARDANPLDEFYGRLGEGLRASILVGIFEDVLASIRASGGAREYSLGHGRKKVLKDEVSPAVRLAKQLQWSNESIRFSLDNRGWDFEVASPGGPFERVEVTAALRKTAHFLNEELNETGVGRGYGHTSEILPRKTFKREIRREISNKRTAYSTDDALSSMLQGVTRCLEAKAEIRDRWRSRGGESADSLLIEAPLNNLPIERWTRILPELRVRGRKTGFKRIFLICDSERPDVGFSLH